MKKKKFCYVPVNAIECLECGQYLLSLHVHDYRACECGSMVDGGFDYRRRSVGKDGARELELYAKQEIK